MGLLSRAKPYIGVIWLQLGISIMSIIAKFALNQGLNHYTFVVYRHAIATIIMAPFALILERNIRPRMSFGVFGKIFILSLFEPVADQNLFYASMNNSTATFVTALCNVLPAITFTMAWIFRLEKVDLKKIRSQAKVMGTVVTIMGAMVMTLVKGPVVGLPWTKGAHTSIISRTAPHKHDQIKGALLVFASCISWSCFITLQAITLKSYPAELSLAVLICASGTLQALVLALAMEWGNTFVWEIHLDIKLLAYVYSGVVCSGLGYYIQGGIMKERGPVFITSFAPLGMVIVAVISSFIFTDQLFVGSVIGAIVIVVGLYLVMWGKSKDQQRISNTNAGQILNVHPQLQEDA